MKLVKPLIVLATAVVIGNADPEFHDVSTRLTHGQNIVDLVRINSSRSIAGIYEGLCW